MMKRLQVWARRLKGDVLILWLAARDPRTPWQARIVAALAAAYALSPVDLIPDFIPVLGYLDDLVLVPAGVWLALSLIPAPLRRDLRLQAEAIAERPASWAAASLILVVWILLALFVSMAAWQAIVG